MEQRRFEIVKGYEDKNINLPKRSTEHAAGYDVESAENIEVKPMVELVIEKTIPKTFQDSEQKISLKMNKPILVKTGINARLKDGEFLLLANRSSGPIKRNLVLGNSIGVLDGDYIFNSSNEIMFQFYNFGNETVFIKKGEKIGQAIFMNYNKADDDISNNVKREGGFGSTDRKINDKALFSNFGNFTDINSSWGCQWNNR